MALEGIVFELEREALDESISVESLLRKAYLVAKKLKLEDFEEWIGNEQKGYKGAVPEYRKINGNYQAWNPYVGWIPVLLSPEAEKKISNIPLHQSISSLSEMYASNEQGVRFLVSAEINDMLNKITDAFETYYSFNSSKSEIYRILSTVRNKVLDWALLLEENGIIGEGMTFTDEEKMKAQTVQVINNYTNNFFSDVSDVEMKQGK